MPTYRAIELTLYAVMRIIPYLILMMYIFSGRFRFPKWVIITAAVLVTALRCLCTYIAYFDPTRLSDPNPGILIFVVLSILLVKDHWGKALFSMWMLTNVSSLAVTAAKYFESLIFGDIALQFHRWTNVLTLFLVEAAILIPLFFYIKKIYMRAIQHDISSHTWRLIWLVPFTFYAVWYRNSFFATENHELLSFDLVYVFFCFLVNGGGMLIYTLVVRLINERVANDRLRENELQLTIKQKQFETLQERIEEARTAKHDMRQHLHLISAYLADKKYDELEAYINSFRKTIPENSSVRYCEHYGINALLQYFAGVAREHNIGFSAHIELPEAIAIPNDVLAVLIGNLLENATEACLSEGHPLITVRGKLDGNQIFFKVINTFTGKLKRAPNGLYLSTKHEGRGIGLRSVRSIVGDYNGILKIDNSDGLFSVSMLLNIPNEK